MTLWRVNRWNVTIEAVEVLGETEKFVSILSFGRKTRVSKAGEFFPTFQEARNYLLDHFASRKAAAEQSALNYQKRWEEAAALTEKVTA